jgi:ankyrin repeat protein/pimeloyl-ACP methyl ester carboxylesterase
MPPDTDRQTDRPWMYRIEHIPAGTSPSQLLEKFTPNDRPKIKVQSLVPAIEEGKLVAIISYPSSLPPPETTDEDLEIDCMFIGLTPLNTPEEPILANVVAVTGLAGHAFGSWSSPPRQMWLKDFLPKDIANVAIYTYGYDSRLQHASGRHIISDHARRFVGRLAYLISATIGPPRPLILVGHSLGGLIVKRALCELKNSNSKYHQPDLILPCAIFLGTPHRGLKADALAALVEQEPSRDIVDEVKPDSPTLRELNDQFGRLLGQMDIATFYELATTPTLERGPDGEWAQTGPPALMVKHDSAVLGLPNEVPLPCDGNHKELARLKRGQASIYLDIVVHIKKALEPLRPAQNRFTTSISQTAMQTQTLPQLPSPECQNSKPHVKAREPSNASRSVWSAAEAGDQELLIKPIASGANVEAKNGRYQETALSVASSKGNEKIVRTLIEGGANLNAQDPSGQTPLHLAIKGECIEVMETLLRAGADKESRNAKDETPLMYACVQNKPRAVQALVDAGANLETKSANSKTPLYHSARKGLTAIVEILIKGGANKDTLGKNDWTPLHISVYYKHTEISTMLLKTGANPRTKNNVGFTALFTAIREKHQEIIPLIIRALHGKVNDRSDDGRTALHIAAEKNNTDAAIRLCTARAFIDARDKEGWTPLYMAVVFKSEPVARILIEAGANPLTTPEKRPNIIDLARSKNMGPLAGLLSAACSSAFKGQSSLKSSSKLNANRDHRRDARPFDQAAVAPSIIELKDVPPFRARP